MLIIRVIWHLKQIGKVKNSISRFRMSWPQIKNVVVSKSHLYFVQQQQTISWLDCDMLQKVDFIQHLTMSNLVAEPRRSSKALPKAKLAPKKSWLLVVCCPPNALQLSESQRKHCIWEVCSANQWDALKTTVLAASIVQQKGPNSSPWQYPNVHCTTTCCVNNASKVEWMGLWNFASSAIFTWPLTNWLPLLQASQQLFAGKTLSQAAGGWKCFLRVRWLLKHRICYRNKQTYFSLAKWVDCNGSYFD